jgi:hypothetical protein
MQQEDKEDEDEDEDEEVDDQGVGDADEIWMHSTDCMKHSVWFAVFKGLANLMSWLVRKNPALYWE